jgi:arabinan endo-1,5-alpha-L-arabinosidase
VRLAPLVTVVTAALIAVATVALAPAASAAPAAAPKTSVLKGDIGVHDPSIYAAHPDGKWYVFSSGRAGVGGGTVGIRSSVDGGHTWTYLGTMWKSIPSWATDMVPGANTMWAPAIHEHGGTFYLYYAVSTIGKNNSVVGLATNTTLDPADPAYKWVDQGKVVRSLPASDFNAIDPEVVDDAAGTPWLVFGSYWSGIQMVQLQWPSGKRSADPQRYHLADRKIALNAIEAPTIVSHAGYYYLLTSWDRCCLGVNSTYKIVVGRSKSVTGPYVDENGTSLMNGGGTVLLKTSGNRIGPGGEAVSGGVIAYHYYDSKANGASRLGLRRLTWGDDGWPQIPAGDALPPATPTPPSAAPAPATVS